MKHVPSDITLYIIFGIYTQSVVYFNKGKKESDIATCAVDLCISCDIKIYDARVLYRCLHFRLYDNKQHR